MPPFDISSLPKVISSHFQRTEATQATGRLGTMTVSEGKAETPPAQTSSFKEKAAAFFHSVGNFFSKIGDRISQAFHDLKARWTPEAPATNPVLPQQTQAPVKQALPLLNSVLADPSSGGNKIDANDKMRDLIDAFKTKANQEFERTGVMPDWTVQLTDSLTFEALKFPTSDAKAKLDAFVQVLKGETGNLGFEDFDALAPLAETVAANVGTPDGLTQLAHDSFKSELGKEIQQLGTFFRSNSVGSRAATAFGRLFENDVKKPLDAIISSVLTDPGLQDDIEMANGGKGAIKEQTEAVCRLMEEVVDRTFGLQTDSGHAYVDALPQDLRDFLHETLEEIQNFPGVSAEDKEKASKAWLSNFLILRTLAPMIREMGGEAGFKTMATDLSTYVTRLFGGVPSDADAYLTKLTEPVQKSLGIGKNENNQWVDVKTNTVFPDQDSITTLIDTTRSEVASVYKASFDRMMPHIEGMLTYI